LPPKLPLLEPIATKDLSALREAAALAKQLRTELLYATQEGVTPKELDSLASDFCKRSGARAVLKGYNGYPAAICVSVNDAVLHGVPSARPFSRGDVVTVDLALKLGRMHADCAATKVIGAGSRDVEKLVQVARGATDAGIAACKAGSRVGDISAAIESYARFHEHLFIREFGGHGIGRRLHAEPTVLSFGRAGTGEVLVEGLTLTIEPALVTGGSTWRLDDDGWTIRTVDGGFGAQFEEMVYIGPNGPEVLTGD